MTNRKDVPFSILDLSWIREGETAREALHDTLALAQHAERLGYHRFWLAEHHNMQGIASAATSVALATSPAAPPRFASAPVASCCPTILPW